MENVTLVNIDFNDQINNVGYDDNKEALKKAKVDPESKSVQDLVDSIIAEIDRTVKAINDDTLLVFKNSKSGNKLVSIDPSFRMVQKVRNGYRTKVGYGKKNERIGLPKTPSSKIPERRFKDEEGFDPIIEYFQIVKQAIKSGFFNTNLEGLLESFRERAIKGQEAQNNA